MAKTTDRDRATGRYRHTWAFNNFDLETGREVAQCETCEAMRAYGGGRPDRSYKTTDAAIRAGEPVRLD